MQKWEYLIKPKSYTVDELNILGQDGWEMCGFDYVENDDSELFMFKRPTSDIKLNPTSCPHCIFLHETFTDEQDYDLMTEVFVYLHGGDVCNHTSDTYDADMIQKYRFSDADGNPE